MVSDADFNRMTDPQPEPGDVECRRFREENGTRYCNDHACDSCGRLAMGDDW